MSWNTIRFLSLDYNMSLPRKSQLFLASAG
nr:MAG TPA: hypothetical protein [Caudoviricetes sp.]